MFSCRSRSCWHTCPAQGVSPLNGPSSSPPVEILHTHGSCYCQNGHNKQEMVWAFPTFWEDSHELKLEYWRKLLKLEIATGIVYLLKSESFCWPPSISHSSWPVLLTRSTLVPRAAGRAPGKAEESRSSRIRVFGLRKSSHL